MAGPVAQIDNSQDAQAAVGQMEEAFDRAVAVSSEVLTKKTEGNAALNAVQSGPSR